MSEAPLAGLCEQLARFRGRRLAGDMLRRRGWPLALCRYALPRGARLLDLDEPAILAREHLRPSSVATRRREVTQDTARRLFARHSSAAGIRWWSTIEASWINLTLFDVRLPRLAVAEGPRALELEDALVTAAAAALGMA